jgi:hypothetical protein
VSGLKKTQSAWRVAAAFIAGERRKEGFFQNLGRQ